MHTCAWQLQGLANFIDFFENLNSTVAKPGKDLLKYTQHAYLMF